MEKATEEYFQATADVADCEGELTEKVFEAIHLIHSKWDEMDYAAQEQFRDVIDSYMDSREEYLSKLPIEVRQRLEERYPKWW